MSTSFELAVKSTSILFSQGIYFEARNKSLFYPSAYDGIGEKGFVYIFQFVSCEVDKVGGRADNNIIRIDGSAIPCSLRMNTDNTLIPRKCNQHDNYRWNLLSVRHLFHKDITVSPFPFNVNVTVVGSVATSPTVNAVDRGTIPLL